VTQPTPSQPTPSQPTQDQVTPDQPSAATASGSGDTGARQSIADFYDADPRRRESEEVEYGDGWTRHDDVHATYRLSHVRDTGELYLVREPHPGGILARYLDQLGVDQADVDELLVEVLAVLPAEEVDRVLDGWQQAMHGTDSLPWVRARVGSRASS
jgi:hypothetical protein